jgi:hypothetical protein
LTSRRIVSTLSFTRRCRTDWLPHRDAALEELVHGALGDLRDLARVVEVRVEDDLLVQLAPVLDDARERVRPRLVGEDLLRHDGRALGREAHAPHVLDAEQRLADERDLLGAQLVHVAARDDDVLELGARADVLERLLPAVGVDLELELRDLLRVDADGVAARAEAAVDGARVEREEERLVDVAVREPRHRHVRRARAANRGRASGDRAGGASRAGRTAGAADPRAGSASR